MLAGFIVFPLSATRRDTRNAAVVTVFCKLMTNVGPVISAEVLQYTCFPANDWRPLAYDDSRIRHLSFFPDWDACVSRVARLRIGTVPRIRQSPPHGQTRRFRW